MVDTSHARSSINTDGNPKFSFPSAYTILFALTIIMAALTWIIPAGNYDRVTNEALGKDVAVPGTYKLVETNPQNWLAVYVTGS